MSAPIGKGNRFLNVWTQEEDKFLREHRLKMSYAKIGERLGRSGKAVQARAYKLDGNRFPQRTI